MDCWTHELDKASTAEEVLNRANDYLCLWAARELDGVELGPGGMRVESAADVDRVKRSLMTPLVSMHANLRELGTYFWRASTRLRELRA